MDRVVRLQGWVGMAVRGLVVQQVQLDREVERVVRLQEWEGMALRVLVGREVQVGTLRAGKRLPLPRPPASNVSNPLIRLQLTRVVGCSAMSVTGGGITCALVSPMKCLRCSAGLWRKGCRVLGSVLLVSHQALK